MITVAIQAGGRSSRMGRDKGLAPLAGKPMLEHLLARVDGLGNEILLTTNFPEKYACLGLRMVSDEIPGAGALPGLSTALQASRGKIVLVLACDMPFVNRPLLEHLLSFAHQADVIVPRWEGVFQTMHAVYVRDSCLTAVQAAIEKGEKRMVSFYPQVHVLTIEADEIARFDPNGRSFFNVNTPNDLTIAEEMLA